ncbi:MAG: hypothetical protein V4773_22390 [Verrucomicrobiota bacterium]
MRLWPWISALVLAVVLMLLASSPAFNRMRPGYSGLPSQIEGSFTRDGQYPGEALANAFDVRSWGSWSGDDAHTGVIRFGPLRAPARLRVAFSGYPLNQGIQLFLERTDTKARLPIYTENVGERWQVKIFTIPADWIEQEVVFTAVDNSTAMYGWMGVSEPLAGEDASFLRALAAWLLSGVLLGSLWLVALRAVLEREQIPQHFAPLVAAAVVALCGYVAFWMYFASPILGKIYSVALLVFGLTKLLEYRGRVAFPREVLVPAALLAAVGFLYIGILHLYANSIEQYPLAAYRWGALPADNHLPQLVANDLYRGASLRWPEADWLSSDRPPLQSGWILLLMPAKELLGLDAYPFGALSALWLQSLWVFGLYGLFVTLQVARPRALVLVGALALNGFFLLHTVYTWPKMAAGAFVCGAFALYFEGGAKRMPHPHLLLCSALLALAWLAHGGVAFSLLALAPWAAHRLGLEPRRAVLAAAAFAVLALPWMAYQKFYDPPGNRLLKWHLGGQVPKDTRGTLQTIREAYAGLTWSQIAEHKVANLKFQTAGTWPWIFTVSEPMAQNRRNDEFFVSTRALGWWALGLLALPWLLLRRRAAFPVGIHAALLVWIFLTLLVWCLLMFIPGSTVVHQGSFAMMLAAFALLASWLSSASRWAVGVVVALQLVSFSATWLPPAVAARAPLNPLAVAGIGVAVIALVVLLWKVGRAQRATAQM